MSTAVTPAITGALTNPQIAGVNQGSPFGLKVTYYFQGKAYPTWLKLTQQDITELHSAVEPLKDYLQDDRVIDLTTLISKGQDGTSTDIPYSPQINQQIQKILEIAGRALHSRDTNYAQKHMPKFAETCTDRGDTCIAARQSFCCLSDRMQRFFQTTDRDKILAQLDPNNQVSSENYFQAWVCERLIHALKEKIKPMKEERQLQLQGTPQNKQDLENEIAALDRFENYLDKVDLFRLNYAILFKQQTTQERIDRLRPAVLDSTTLAGRLTEGFLGLKAVITRKPKPADSLNENEEHSIAELALLPIQDRREYLKESHDLCLLITRDAPELPLTRLTSLGALINDFFKNTYIQDIRLPLTIQGKLDSFISDFLKESPRFQQEVLQQLTPAQRKNWSKILTDQQKNPAQKTAYPNLFLDL